MYFSYLSNGIIMHFQEEVNQIRIKVLKARIRFGNCKFGFRKDWDL